MFLLFFISEVQTQLISFFLSGVYSKLLISFFIWSIFKVTHIFFYLEYIQSYSTHQLLVLQKNQPQGQYYTSGKRHACAIMPTIEMNIARSFLKPSMTYCQDQSFLRRWMLQISTVGKILTIGFRKVLSTYRLVLKLFVPNESQ